MLRRYVRGEISENDRRTVVEWLRQDNGNLKEYMSLRRLYDIELTVAPDAPDTIRTGRNGLRKRGGLVFRYAVGCAAAVILFAGGLWLGGKSEDAVTVQQVFVPAGQRSELVLADGTKVWLGPNTSLKYPGSFNPRQRTVELDGEAFFDVTSDPAHPFIVKTGRYDIRVLGTEFNVIAYSRSDYWETALLKGKVELRSTGDPGDNRVLLPDRKIVCRGDRVFEENIDGMNYEERRNGIDAFRNRPLGDILERLGRQKGYQFEIRNARNMDVRYSGKFRNEDSLEHILHVLSLDKSFSYRIDEADRKVTIY